jgi:hypothetical protein
MPPKTLRCSCHSGGVQCSSEAFYKVGYLDDRGRPRNVEPLCFTHAFEQADAYNARKLIAILKPAVDEETK